LIAGAVALLATASLLALGLTPQDSSVPAAGVPFKAGVTGVIAMVLLVAGGWLLRELRRERNSPRER
jgi:hypothetical protein